MGVPVLPVLVPGAAVSPGSRSWSFATAPTFTVIEALVLLAIPACVTSEAVKVQVPPVLLVTAKALVPDTNAALAGNVALGSVEVIEIVSLVLTRFQFASTALTVRLKLLPAVWAVGAPVLPEAVPGAAVSPGVSK